MSFGVLLATLSNTLSSRDDNNVDENGRYYTGISMLTCSLVLTGILGVLQERTYKKYGPCWKEGVFYTVSRISVARHKLLTYLSPSVASIISTSFHTYIS